MLRNALYEVVNGLMTDWPNRCVGTRHLNVDLNELRFKILSIRIYHYRSTALRVRSAIRCSGYLSVLMV